MKRYEKQSNATNLIIALLSCSLAPIISHVLDLIIVDNLWNTERILLLYFSSATGYIIQDKIYRTVMNTCLYKKGFKLGNSDALGFIIWLIPVSIVVVLYNDLVSSVVLSVMIIAAIIITAKDYKVIRISSRIMMLIGVGLIILLIMSIQIEPLFELYNPFKIYLIWIASQIVVGFLWDLTAIAIKKINA